MTTAQVLATFGPLVCASGAFLLAYDIARGQLRLTWRRLLEARARRITEQYERIVERYQSLPETTHGEVVKQWIREARGFAEKELQDTKSRQHRFEDDEQEASLRYGIRGLVLIIVGSLMQSAGAWLSS